MSELHKELSRIEFEMRENSMTHTPIENEMRFYEAVKRGDMDAARTLSTPLGGEGFGVLSTDRLRNLKYHLVITVSFITRFCVEGWNGTRNCLQPQRPLYKKSRPCKFSEEINAIHSELITDFTERMAKLKNGSSYCYQVTKCMEYVYDHLHEKLMVSDIAEELGLSVQYLSKLFRTETGLTLNRYILKKKIDAACQMLKYSQYEAVGRRELPRVQFPQPFYPEIPRGNRLTPKQYREKYYHSSSGMKAGVEIK